MDFEPATGEEEKPTLPDATAPAAAASAAPSPPAYPILGDASPSSPLTPVDLCNQMEEGKRVLKRLHDQLACLDSADATTLDEQTTKT